MARKLPDDPAPWTVVSSEYLFRRPPWLTLRQERLRLPSGREIPEYWISEFPPWVNVVAVTTVNPPEVRVDQIGPTCGTILTVGDELWADSTVQVEMLIPSQAESPISSGVTIQGPITLPPSKLLPLAGPSRPSISTRWASRAEKSLKIVKPKM